MVISSLCGGSLVAAPAGPQTRSAAASGYRFATDAGPCEVGEWAADWSDDVRHRAVPVKVYYPKGATGTSPVIIFSHGLGGSRDGYAYLGRHWASHGYVCVHLQHKGSDEDVWRGKDGETARKAMREAATAQNAIDRVRDVAFAVDQLAKLNKSAGPLQGRLDADRVGVAGHSFGAHTTLSTAGAQSRLWPAGAEPRRRPRITAAIAMSPPPPRMFQDTYGGIDIPCLHMTGTADDSPLFAIEAKQRRIPFEQIRAGDQYLVTFEGGDHMVFSAARPRPAREQKDRRIQSLIRGCTLAFWDAWLKGDADAKRWLSRDMRAAMAPDAAVEFGKAGR